jgi:hypothetical protein
MRRALAPLAAASAAVAGCGEPEPANLTAEQVAAELGAMRIEPGLWELTSAVVGVSAPDLPVAMRDRMIGPRRRLRHCISPAQAARPGASFLAMRAGSECTYPRFAIERGRLTGTMVCPDATTTMDGRYGPRGYDLRMIMESPLGNGEVMTLQLRAQGRRIGDCEEETTG